MKANNIEKIIKIVEDLMLSKGLLITNEDREYLRDFLSTDDIEDKIKEVIELYESRR